MITPPTKPDTISIAKVLAKATQLLQHAGHDDARLEAEVLLAHVRGVNRTQLYVDMLCPLDPDQSAAYAAIVQRHLANEPVAYIVGHREFFGLTFRVDRRVLIPRPETEMLVEMALQVARQHYDGSVTIADVGTGSGAIAISLAVAWPPATLYAIDASSASLEVAAANCRAHGIEDRVVLLHGDLLSSLPSPVDIVTANLPYIPSAAMTTLPPDIVSFEPASALDGGQDGLDVYRRLLPQLPGRVNPGGRVFLEIAADQGPAMIDLVASYFPGIPVRIDRDYAGLDRFVSFSID